ncbi:MAG: Exocyst complex component 5 [Alyxoria varia]|nr:MAG: Exocyst complex component 5 [Alyxoria varia]
MPPLGAADNASLYSQSSAPSVGGKSIYPRGPGFSLDTFSSKDFIVKDFIESLSDGTTVPNRRSGGDAQAFDPKPYIRTFEHGLSRLDALSEERESHESELASAVRRAEAQHRQNCSTLQRKLDQTLESFNNLETRLDSSITTGGGGGNGYNHTGPSYSSALEIGERLEELDRQKRRAEDAKVLIRCWQDVSERGDLTYLEDVRRMGGGEGKVKCAQIARQLLKISNNIGSGSSLRHQQQQQANGSSGSKTPNGDGSPLEPRQQRGNMRTNEIIEKFLERLEKDLLEQFEDRRRQHNDTGMRECATALYDFSEGSSVIARYVNQHEFFLERSHMITEEVSEDNESWDRLADPDSEPPGIEPSLQSLVDEVKLILQEESFTIKQVFPFHEQVLVTFIQRVFQQSIQQRLELVLEKATSVSPIAFLRSLQSARTYIGSMVEDLKSHGLTEHPDPTSSQASACLDQQLEDLFVPYFAGSSYIECEKRSLEELYGSLLFKFTLYHSKRRKTPTTYLGTLGQKGRELLASARDNYIDHLDSSDLPQLQKTILLRVAGIKDADTKNKADIEVTEEDGKLSLPVAKRMLKWLAEAVGRGLELSGGSDTPKDVAALLRLLLVHLGEIYLDTALDAANETAEYLSNPKTEPDLAHIPDTQTCISILALLTSISHKVLLPLCASNLTITRETTKTLNTHLTRFEDKISTIRTRTIDSTLTWTSKLLQKQQRADFRPKDDTALTSGIESLQTPTCASIFTFLTRVHAVLQKESEGKNAEILFTELAVGFRSLLLEHLKKFQVNQAGGLMVSKDITKYCELLRGWPLAREVLPSLEVLVEVGNIFVIGPDALKERLRGGTALAGGGTGSSGNDKSGAGTAGGQGGGTGAAATWDRKELRPYIARREDVGTVGVQSALNSL